MNTMKRRTFLKGALASSVIAVAAGKGLLRPSEALAADWPKKAFTDKDIKVVLKSLFGSDATTPSKAIKIDAPIQAESGLAVPITVSSTLPNIEGMAIIVENNPSPLAASVEGSGATKFRTRIKMGKSSPVLVVVKSKGKLYSARQEIKVTSGGCGG